MMEAYTIDFQWSVIEYKSFFRIKVESPDSDFLFISVDKLRVLIQIESERIKIWSIYIPELRGLYVKRLKLN